MLNRSAKKALALALVSWQLLLPPKGNADTVDSPLTSNDSHAEVRHAVFMLEPAPLLLRLRISIGGQSLTDARQQFVARLIDQLDSDHDGLLTREELAKSPLLRRHLSPRATAFLQTLDSRQTVSNEEVTKTVQRVAGESVVYRQDDSASASDDFVFGLLDENGSGVIETQEMATAAKRLAERDMDQDECVGYDEVQPAAVEAPQEPATQLVGVEQSTTPQAAFSELLRDVREPLLPRRLLRKYDRDRNGQLSGEELQWTSDRLATIDRNGDQAVSLNELRDLSVVSVDLDLSIDLQPDDPAHPQFTMVAGEADRIQASTYPGLVRTRLEHATITISHRQVDPIPEAINAAMRRFNQLDIDGNGYLDLIEIQPDVRLRRGLFEMIDTDGDGKLFGEEIEAFVRLRGEPESLTCCVNVYDTGSGFFQVLDHNNDGRISQRELRTVDKSLERLQRDDREGLTLEEPPRHFHIELVRGGYRLFGPFDQTPAQLPVFYQGVAVGPVWFQRMDRNNDGDLTWREFLGHREDFYRLDADSDGLIDPSEAASAPDVGARD